MLPQSQTCETKDYEHDSCCPELLLILHAHFYKAGVLSVNTLDNRFRGTNCYKSILSIFHISIWLNTHVDNMAAVSM